VAGLVPTKGHLDPTGAATAKELNFYFLIGKKLAREAEKKLLSFIFLPFSRN